MYKQAEKNLSHGRMILYEDIRCREKTGQWVAKLKPYISLCLCDHSRLVTKSKNTYDLLHAISVAIKAFTFLSDA